MSQTRENPDNLSVETSQSVPVGSELSANTRLQKGDLLLIVGSPKAGAGNSGARIALLKERIAAAGLETAIESDITTVQKRVAEELLSKRRLCVAAAGGDGTLNLLASVLSPSVPLLPFPLGTENLVARHFGLLGKNGSFDINVAVDAVLNGRNHRIDAGVATFLKRNGSHREKMFLIMASVGFDAEVVRRMHLTRKGHIHRLSYLKPILAVLRRYRYPRISVESGEELSCEHPIIDEAGLKSLSVAWGLIFNLPRYAVGLSIESMADETDGQLDFCGLDRGSHFHGLRYLLGVVTQRHTSWKDVKRFRASWFKLNSKTPIAVQLDGDYAGRLPMEVRVEPRRVTLRLPNRFVGLNPT